MYQQTRLSDLSPIGAPGPIPYCVANWHDTELADLDAMKLDASFGLAGMGIWPVDVVVPSYDATHQVVVPPTACDHADATAKRWSATATVREMTDAEYAAANPVPELISDRQFFQQLALDGDITTDEALAAVTVGAMPQKIADAINSLPAAQQFGAKMALCGATEFLRHNSYVALLGPIFQKTSRQIDDVWRRGSLIQ